ncbi:Hydrogenase maturation factor HybF [Sporomusa carbonis]|uniref:hydrogenase maturation nickel metallochaperone HypA n=1 Tax=Sporomusa carbonis TaxID=3076075 RepID=UPI003A6C5106
MHELAIAQSVLDIALSTAASHNARRVTGIKILAGELTGVVPEALEFSFAALAGNTIAADAGLSVSIVPLRGRCRDCREEFAILSRRFFCPCCGSPGVEITAGRELSVEYVEVE